MALLPRRRLRPEADKIDPHAHQTVDANLHSSKGFQASEVYMAFFNKIVSIVPWLLTVSTPFVCAFLSVKLVNQIFDTKEITVFDDRE